MPYWCAAEEIGFRTELETKLEKLNPHLLDEASRRNIFDFLRTVFSCYISRTCMVNIQECQLVNV